METLKKIISGDKLLLVGLILIAISTALFLLPDFNFIQFNKDSYFGLFFTNYFLATLYLLFLLINSIIKFKWAIFKNNLEYVILLLILYLISAFSLNREIPVFEQSTEWVCIFLTTQCVTLIILVFRKYFPFFIRYILSVVLGAGILVYIYYAIYLVPLYLIGMLGTPFFGISLHVFTPLLFVLFTCLLLAKIATENKKVILPFFIGLSVPLIISIYFMYQWQKAREQINSILNESIISETTLPVWANLSQRLEKNVFTEKILKTDLIYSTPDPNGNWFWGMPQKSFDAVRKHDPLVMMSTFFIGKTELSEAEKIKILESIYDSRHEAQERLWSGDMLDISNVISNIKIFPEYRLAYTEKIISVRNNYRSAWRSEQEAIFTFHLPEGGVVTSLSLWIDGKEEKGIMTTKSKADSAYKTIVGVEQRDPSVVHWQEGNTVSVRVFPCTPKENRRFKIGVSAPLKSTNDKLIYENIYFDGPPCTNTTEIVQVEFTSKPVNMESSFKLDESGPNIFKSNKKYDPYWELTFNAPILSDKGFSFDGCNYSVEKYNREYKSFIPQNVYLDLNKAWTKDELMILWPQIKNKNVYAFNEQMIKINDENINDLFDRFQQFNYSLFPLHKMKNSGNLLIISKSTSASPNLSDLAKSDFSNQLTSYLKDKHEIHFFNLGQELSPYLKTLKELRTFTFDQGNANELEKLLKEDKFINSIEDESTVVIVNSGIQIREKDSTDNSGAPDHLLRLFAYNHIMQKVSANYFKAGQISDEAVAEAQKAYVVSPVSSLIVLETKQDYDRFDIQDSKNSLKNATTKSSGAVPEPHEWLLIMLTVCVVIYFMYKSNFNI
ncbi:MAG: XrtN system VIT domain-containing protein [Bacteroidetes bacterium]|nr:XrtN system VIT domain-containing protein [Bacteroidota bacterium]